MNTPPEGPTPFFERPSTATLAIVLSCIGFGLAPLFVKELTALGIAPPVIAFYRYSFVAVLLLPLLKLRGEYRIPTLWGILSGIVAGLGWIGYINILNYLPVSTSGVIYMTYPLFTVVLGYLWFRSPVGLRSVSAASMILLAAVIALSPRFDGSVSYLALAGAFCAPLGFAFSIVVLTDKLLVLPPLSRVSSMALGGSLALLPLVLSYETERILPDSPDGYWLVASIAMLTALLPQFLYSWFAPVIGSAKTSIAGSTELPTMFIVGWLVFGETLTLTQLSGGLLVLLAILIAPSQQRSVMANIHRRTVKQAGSES
ncbi:MAG: DMT family transporter [Alphaproteobacteria bacterium]